MTRDEAYDHLPAAVFRVGRDFRYLYVNDQLCRETGLTPDQYLGKTVEQIGFPKPLAELFVASVGRVFDTGQPAESSFVFPSGEGPRNILSRLVRDPDGESVLGVATDVTRMARAEADRARVEEQFRAFMEHSPAMAWMKDEAGRYVYLNATCLREFGPAIHSWIGRTDAEVWPADVAAEFRENDRKVLSTGQPIQVTETNVRPDGTRFVSANVKFLFTDQAGGRYVGGMGIDITPWAVAEDTRRRAEAELHAERERQKFEKQLFQSQKLESLGVLAGGIAHDFNNLLTSILGNAGLARMYLPFAEGPAVDCLGQVETAAQRAADLCQQMLAYAGRGQFLVRPVDLNRLLDEMGQLLTTVVSKKVVLRMNLTRPLPPVECDPTQVRQVAMNLITNGSDAIGSRSGVVTVTTGVIDADDKYLADFDDGRESPPGRYVYLEVSDTGCGMDEETKERMFDPFFTTKATGRGLGLAAVRGVVTGHRGAIKVYSQVGRGTTFKILFPAGSKEPVDPVAAVVTPSVFGGGKAVLVIDDEEDVRVFTRKALERAGFVVVLAADGRAGVDAFKAEPDRFSFVVSDLTMPKLGGAEVYRELRTLRPGVKVILTSGFAPEEAMVGFEGKGLTDFLRKPFRVQDLLAAARAAVG
jgi:two-component system cell cycle sensor histidine kinase/response regulator CckA